MDCSKLTTGLIAAECNKLASTGAEDDVILINYSEVDKTTSVVTDNVVSNLILKEGAKGYVYSTFGRSLDDSGSTFTKGTYRNTWLQNIMLRIFTKNEEAKKFVNDFGAGAKIIAIIKNKETGTEGEVKYEIYGWDNGLELNEATSTLAMADGVVYDLNVGSSDAAQEGSLPKSFFDTDLATTEQKIAALIAD